MAAIAEFLTMLGKAAEAATNLTNVIKTNVETAYEIKDKYAARRQREDWIELLEMMVAVQERNAPIGYNLTRLVSRLEDGDKTDALQTELRTQLQGMAVHASKAREFLTSFHGDLIFADHKLYDDLLQTLRMREHFAQDFSRDNLKLTRDMAGDLRRIAELYGELIVQLRENRHELATFIEHRSRATE